ncbi:MAG TPA: Mrp/NBP35 family ATP-binding protein [Spirochaetia bacterium]|nr:Mrp/NBP35 family ATP-binding protein [Spirochaetia bacterium]
MSEENANGCDGASNAGLKPAYEEPHRLSHIGRVIAVMSGKGGVGKSTVTALLAVELARRGYSVGILDADITGPSIPKMFGLTDRAVGVEEGIMASITRRWGIRVMSMNLVLKREDEAVIWRGPLIGGVIKQFWKDVIWGDVDYLLIDLPPGTGDAPLTVMQSIPVSGLIAVSSPQDLAVMVVKKALHMAQVMEVPVMGRVENMTYVTCPKCGDKIYVFGEPQGVLVSDGGQVPLLAALPLDPQLSRLADAGKIEDYVPAGFDGFAALWNKEPSKADEGFAGR